MLAEIRQLSYISTVEYVETVATWEYYTNSKQFNCKSNIKKMKDSARIEAFKNRNGCDKRMAKTPRQKIDDIAFYDCFCNHLSPSFDSYIYMHEQYSKGFLPFSGSVLEQPNKAMDAIALIGKLKSDREAKMQEKSGK